MLWCGCLSWTRKIWSHKSLSLITSRIVRDFAQANSRSQDWQRLRPAAYTTHWNAAFVHHTGNFRERCNLRLATSCLRLPFPVDMEMTSSEKIWRCPRQHGGGRRDFAISVNLHCIAGPIHCHHQTAHELPLHRCPWATTVLLRRPQAANEFFVDAWYKSEAHVVEEGFLEHLGWNKTVLQVWISVFK